MRRFVQVAAVVCASAFAMTAHALDEAGVSAVSFLSNGTTLHRDGRHGRILVSLRHLRDRALEPLFAHLAGAPQTALQVHGMLGLAEISQDRHLALSRLAEIERPEAQAMIISTALDARLLTDEDVDRLSAWTGLDPSVKVLLSLRRFRDPGFDGRALLHESLAADKLGRRGLAALMLHQLGEQAGTQALMELNASTDPERDAARRMLLQTAITEGLDRAGTWAYSVATDTKADELTQLLGLRAALRLGERRAVELWKQRFAAATTDPAAQVRLALTALHASPWSPPELFQPLRESSDPLLRQIGDTGHALAVAGPTGGAVAEQVVALLLQHHPYTNAWALGYAREHATPEDAQLIFLGLIKAFDQGPSNTRQKRVQETVEASKLLHERFPDLAMALLRPMLADDQTSDLTKQAILLGLLQSRHDVVSIVADLPPMGDVELASVALVLKATTAAPLSDREMADLRLLVRGGAALRDELRAQAAWAYLVRTGQAPEALAQLTR